MELLEHFALGDLGAFETLFRQFQGEVYAWIVCIVRDPGAAEDLTVETFWRIYLARTRFDATRGFGPWARRIATNAAFDYLKAIRREASLLQHESMENRAGSPSDSAAQRDLRNAIQSAFRQLPAKLRAVATLALIEEKPYAEIAEALSTSVAAVKSREFRAVRLLRKKLKRLGMES
jgi:RNA polymerase sigma-70 factor (ECF subfamily)